MNWEKINLMVILKVLKDMEKKSTQINGEYSITYSNNKDELKISYRCKE